LIHTPFLMSAVFAMSILLIAPNIGNLLLICVLLLQKLYAY